MGDGTSADDPTPAEIDRVRDALNELADEAEGADVDAEAVRLERLGHRFTVYGIAATGQRLIIMDCECETYEQQHTFCPGRMS